MVGNIFNNEAAFAPREPGQPNDAFDTLLRACWETALAMLALWECPRRRKALTAPSHSLVLQGWINLFSQSALTAHSGISSHGSHASGSAPLSANVRVYAAIMYQHYQLGLPSQWASLDPIALGHAY